MDNEDERTAPRNNALSDLHYRRERLLERRGRAQKFYYTLVSVSLLFIAVGPVLAWKVYSPVSIVWIYMLLYALMPLAMLPTYRIRLRQVENDIYELDFQIDLQEFEVSKQESRAEKILRLNDFQLRRYYDLNIRQNSWVFGLGVFCILLGIGVIGMTLFFVMRVADSFETKVITASLGSIGAILSNFVAAIYLKMNAAATQNLASFHSRLVETQKLLLGNLLASRIEDDELRWKTLSELSLRLMGEEKGHPRRAEEPQARQKRSKAGNKKTNNGQEIENEPA